MTTQAQYDAATAATLKVIEAEIQQYVPAMFQSQIPQGMLASFAKQAAKAALDAAGGTT